MIQVVNKWKYSEKNFNFSNSKYNNDECQELLELIDKSKKEELIKAFDIGIQYKYDLYKQYLFENNLFLFEALEYNIKESVYCLIIGAHTASITNTNLILERAIKLALIQFQVGRLPDYGNNDINEKYIESDKKYSGKSIDQNIQACQKNKILNSEEAKELKEYKLKFRDGFSHFTPKNILKGEDSLFHIEGDKNSNLDKYQKDPIFQALEVRQFATNKAEEHLKYVLKIINHLQHKVLEKFGNN